MTYALGTSRGDHHQGAAAADRSRDRGRRHRPLVSLVLHARRDAGDRGDAGGGRARRSRASRSRRSSSGRSSRERFALIGVQGIVRMAMSGFDVAAWDALAIAAGVPLATLLGGKPKPIAGLQQLRARPDGARAGRRRGREAARRRLPRRQAAARLSDAAGGPRGGARGAPAHRRRHRADGRLQPGARSCRKRWRAAARSTARASTGSKSRSATTTMPAMRALERELKTPIQIGENFSLPSAMAAALAAGAADYVMPDLERIGGVTGWLRAAGARRRAATSRCRRTCSPRSARICSPRRRPATSSNMSTGPIRIVREPLRIVDGHAVVPDRPGNGLVWDQAAVERYRI